MVLAETSLKIADIMQRDALYALTTEDREEVAKRMAKYGFVALPVVDKEERLVGIITADDVMDVMKQEATEDIHLMHAVAPIEESYLKTSVFTHWRKRILWLIFSMVWGILTGLVILHYENIFAVLPLVVAFIPRLMDTGGDSASQCTAMIIRGMALDEIEKKHFFKAFLKELGVGSLAGLTLALANIPIMWIMYGANLEAAQVWYICLAFGLTLFLVVVMSKLLGVILPFLSKLVKIDPALISMPLITNIVDVLSILIYFVIVQRLVIPHFPPLG
jgi:magnesium transporter